MRAAAFGLGQDEICLSPNLDRHPGQAGAEEDFCFWETIWSGGAGLPGGLPPPLVSSVPFAELPRPRKLRNLGRSTVFHLALNTSEWGCEAGVSPEGRSLRGHWVSSP